MGLEEEVDKDNDQFKRSLRQINPDKKHWHTLPCGDILCEQFVRWDDNCFSSGYVIPHPNQLTAIGWRFVEGRWICNLHPENVETTFTKKTKRVTSVTLNVLLDNHEDATTVIRVLNEAMGKISRYPELGNRSASTSFCTIEVEDEEES